MALTPHTNVPVFVAGSTLPDVAIPIGRAIGVSIAGVGGHSRCGDVKGPVEATATAGLAVCNPCTSIQFATFPWSDVF